MISFRPFSNKSLIRISRTAPASDGIRSIKGVSGMDGVFDVDSESSEEISSDVSGSTSLFASAS